MEYKNIYLGIIGIIGLTLWGINYFNLYRKVELILPYKIKSIGKISTRSIVFVIGLIGWILVSYSLTGPRVPKQIINSKIDVRDIFIVLDVSGSMNERDFRPNRLTVAKEHIKGFVKLRPKDRIGLIIFGTNPFTLLPLTTDLNLIEKYIDVINIDRDGSIGIGPSTNIGDSIGLAVARLTLSPTKKKIIILLTDGASQTGALSPIQAARESEKHGIKIYSIGIGRKNSGGVDLKTLEEISLVTNGRSYLASDSNALRSILNDIEKLEKTEVEIQGQAVYEEKFLFYLAIGLFLLLLAEFMRFVILKEEP